MTINTTSLGGGGGGFTTRFLSAALILTSGKSGTFITITPGAGQKARLNWLNSNGDESNISIAVAGTDAITSKTLVQSDASSAGKFNIMADGTNNSIGTHRYVTGGIGEAITVIKTSGSTSNAVNYSYELGV